MAKNSKDLKHKEIYAIFSDLQLAGVISVDTFLKVSDYIQAYSKLEDEHLGIMSAHALLSAKLADAREILDEYQNPYDVSLNNMQRIIAIVKEY